jgi:integrase
LARLDVDLLTAYQEFLCEKNLGVRTIGNYEGALITLIRKANKDREIKANINLTGYERIKDMRSKEQKKSKQVPLTEAQLLNIYHLTDLSQEDEEVRDLFLCQSLLGQRISDMPKIFKGEYVVNSLESGDEVISFNVQKTGEEAVLYLFPIAMEIILKYRNKGLKFYNILSDDEKVIDRAEDKLNQSIKRICKKAKLDSEINYVEQRGKNIIQKKEKLYKLIHTHIARHTFITLMCKLGVPKDNVIIATAHTDVKMINDVYLHETVNDKGKKLVESIRNIRGSALFQLRGNSNSLQEKEEHPTNSNFNYEIMKADILAKKELEETTEKQVNNIQTLKQMLAIEKHEEEAQNSRFREMGKAFKAGMDYNTFLEIQAEQNEIAGLADEADQIDIFDNHQKP